MGRPRNAPVEVDECTKCGGLHYGSARGKCPLENDGPGFLDEAYEGELDDRHDSIRPDDLGGLDDADLSAMLKGDATEAERDPADMMGADDPLHTGKRRRGRPRGS